MDNRERIDVASEISKELSKFCIDNIKICQGKKTGEIMVEIISSSITNEKEIIRRLKNVPGIRSIYISDGKRRKLIFGSAVIYDKIGRYTFQISPDTPEDFSADDQEKYDEIRKAANIKIAESVLVLNCGVGIIPIFLSTLAKLVVGIDPDPIAIRDARDNARVNKIKNIEFICCDVLKFFGSSVLNSDVIVVDPPRVGLSKELIFQLSTFDFKTLIYVSCNPATFARDLKIFQNKGVAAKKIQPVGMFPQTRHIETVAELNRESV